MPRKSDDFFLNSGDGTAEFDDWQRDVPAFFQCALRSNRSGELLAISTDDPDKFFEGVKGGSGM